MSSERNIDIFSVGVLILSVIALIMVLIGPFASAYISGLSYNYNSCLTCENSTVLDYVSQIFIIILLIIQIIISINNLLPNKLIPKDTTKIGLIFAGLTFIFALIGLISFGIAYIEDWWPDIGFYGPVVAGLLNTILFYLKQKNQ